MGAIVAINPIKLPIVANFTARYPWPFNRNLCAGNTESVVSSLGAPRKVLGMKSRNVCVTAIEAIIIANVKGGNMFKR